MSKNSSSFTLNSRKVKRRPTNLLINTKLRFPVKVTPKNTTSSQYSSRFVYLNCEPTQESFNKSGKPILIFPDNKISTSKYTIFTFIPKNLFEQFMRAANFFFLILQLLQFFPQFATINPFIAALPLFFIILLTCIKDAAEDYKRHLSDRQINDQKVTTLGFPWINVNYIFNKTALSSIGSIHNKVTPLSTAVEEYNWAQSKWGDVKVGDIIRLQENDPIPADIVVLSTSEADGSCYIETKNLDGETNLKCRTSSDSTQGLSEAHDFARLSMSIQFENPNPGIGSFNGTLRISKSRDLNDSFSASHNLQSSTASKSSSGKFSFKESSLGFTNLLLRGCYLRNTSWVVGIVIYTGIETKIRLNSGKTPTKRSFNDRMMNAQVMLNLLLMFLLCLATCIPGTIIKQRDVTSIRPLWSEFSFSGVYVPSSSLDWFVDGVILFWNAVIAYQNLVPISLYLSLEIVKSLQSFFIYQDIEMYDEKHESRCTPKSWNLADDLGQIEYIFSDKTGTLTRNIMEFKLCSIKGEIFGDGKSKSNQKKPSFLKVESFYDADAMASTETPVFEDPRLPLADFENPKNKPIIDFFTALALCNTVIVSKKENAYHYKAQSPDELALVDAAKMVNFILENRDAKTVTILVNGEPQKYSIVQVIEFDSNRKRMSVILKEETGKIILICKGADTVIFSRLAPGQESLIAETTSHLEKFATDGYRTLCITQRVIPQDEFAQWAESFHEASICMHSRDKLMTQCIEEIETNLTLLGATAIEDKLQIGVPQSIESLSKAGIKIWMLTGDKLETAINIGYSCNLLRRDMHLAIVHGGDDEDDDGGATVVKLQSALEQVIRNGENGSEKFALVIDGRALFYALQNANRILLLELAINCAAVICCRVSPLQKAKVCQLVKEGLGVMCLAIGDGANDVSMIQAAQVGVGIAGEEGMQAAMAADYAISQFKDLDRLLLVHGKWSYIRSSSMVLSFFFKQIAWVFPLFMFQYFTEFSGAFLYDFTYMLLFNTLFTGVPVIIVGVFDKDISDKYIRMIPTIYSSGIHHDNFSHSHFFIIVVESIFYSLVTFAIFVVCVNGDPIDSSGRESNGMQLGTMIALTLLFHVNLFTGVMTCSWTIFTFLSISLSTALAFIVTFISSTAVDSTLYGCISMVFGNYVFWLGFLLSTVICNLPRLIFSYLESIIIPKDAQIIRECEKFGINSEFLYAQTSLNDLDIPSFNRRASLLSANRSNRLSKRSPSIQSPLAWIGSSKSQSVDLLSDSQQLKLQDEIMDPSDPSPARTEMQIYSPSDIHKMTGFSFESNMSPGS